MLTSTNWGDIHARLAAIISETKAGFWRLQAAKAKAGTKNSLSETLEVGLAGIFFPGRDTLPLSC